MTSHSLNKFLIVYLPNGSSTTGSLWYSPKYFSISLVLNIFLESHSKHCKFLLTYLQCFPFHFSAGTLSVCSETISQYAGSFPIRSHAPLLPPFSCAALFHIRSHSNQTGFLAAPWAHISLSYLWGFAFALCSGEVFPPFLFLFIGSQATLNT